MKSILLFILIFFPSFIFCQLIKPSGKTAIVSDSLSLKYFYIDSTNIKGGNGSFPAYLSGGGNGTGNIVFGLGAWQPIITGVGSNNVVIGNTAAYGYSDVYYFDNSIFVGYQAGGWFNANANTQASRENINIGTRAGTNMASSISDSAIYNLNIGWHCGYAGGYPRYSNFIGYNNNYSTTGNIYCNTFGYNNMTYSNGGNNVNVFGNNILDYGSNSAYSDSYCTFLGNNLYLPNIKNYIGQIILSDGAYYPHSNFFVGNLPNAALYIKANVNIDSTGMTLKYHTTAGSSNRTAGFDSVLAANVVDTVFTTAYDSSSIVNITPIQNGAGTIINIAYDRQNSKPGQYFIVRVNALTSNELFNWFLIKVY